MERRSKEVDTRMTVAKLQAGRGRLMRAVAVMVAILVTGVHVAAGSGMEDGSSTLAEESAPICTDLIPEERLHRMFQLASLQEWMFDENKKEVHSCIYEEDGSVLVLPLIDYDKVDLLSYFFAGESPRLPWNNFEFPPYTVLLSTDGKKGKRYHVSCHRSYSAIELAISLELAHVYTLEDHGDGRRRIATLVALEVDVLISESELDDLRKKIEEELEVAEAEILLRNPDGHTERIFLISGTDVERLWPQLKTSIKGTAGNSCGFPATALLVSIVSGGTGADDSVPFSVTGHSLGGTAAQYIASDRKSNSQNYPSGSSFEAYSFNGLGLPRGSDQPDEGLYSYTVKGDWINIARDFLDQTEAGIKWKYVPLASLKDPWRLPPTSRHSMEATRESLCRCVQGKGEIALGDEIDR